MGQSRAVQGDCPARGSEVHGPARSERLVRGEDDAGGVEGVVEVVGGVEGAGDGLGEELLFAEAEAVVVGLVGGVNPLVGAQEFVVLVPSDAVNAAGPGLGVGVDVVAAIAALAVDDGDGDVGKYRRMQSELGVERVMPITRGGQLGDALGLLSP
ncbi:hypothetical protein OAF73_00200 [Planctomycetota bacterium]|nr:hypothetical protein [Planctomycetota bacterium]